MKDLSGKKPGKGSTDLELSLSPPQYEHPNPNLVDGKYQKKKNKADGQVVLNVEVLILSFLSFS